MIELISEIFKLIDELLQANLAANAEAERLALFKLARLTMEEVAKRELK